MQKARHKELQGFYIPGTSIRNMTRLQVRSYPLGVAIIIDGKHTDFLTPHTFENLEEGKHIVEMHHFSEEGMLAAKKEEVELKRGQRSVCKLYFKTPRTLADIGELGK